MTRAILIASAVLLSLASSLPAADIARTAVFTAGQDGQGGYHTYRIPAAITTKAGTVLAFAEGRKNGRGDSGDIDLLLKRSTDGGKTFGPQQIVWDDRENTCGNPCPVIDEKTGRIVLLMTHNLGVDTEKTIKLRTAKGTRTVWVSVSDDDGLSWSPPREITTQTKKPEWTWYATGPGVGIQLKHGAHAGRLVIPCDYVAEPGEKVGNSHVIFSDDGGVSWHIGGEPPQKEFNESQVVELREPAGAIMLNMRNHRPALTPQTPRQRGVAISADGGVTFAEARRDPALIEPVCQASILRYDGPAGGKSRILFANPASTSKREKMTVRASDDDGQTWATVREIHAGPSAYSCLVALPDATVGLLYECGERTPYERIELARFAVGGDAARDLKRDPPPDLCIEINLRRAPIDKLDWYAALRVPEVWHCDDDGEIEALALRSRRKYVRSERSVAFSFLRPAELKRLLDRYFEVDQNSLMLEVRAWTARLR